MTITTENSDLAKFTRNIRWSSFAPRWLRRRILAIGLDIRNCNDRRNNRRMFNAINDRELRDIGIERCAFEAALMLET